MRRSSRPEDLVEPASYALPKGVPALQEDPRWTRRKLFLAAAGAALVSGSAGFVIRGAATPSVPSGSSEIDALVKWARGRASGPIKQLRDGALQYLLVLETTHGDTELWQGTELLVDYCKAHPNAAVQSVPLRERLVLALRGLSAFLPAALKDKLAELEGR